MHRRTALAVPQHRGFPLIGNADGGDVLGPQLGAAQRRTDHLAAHQGQRTLIIETAADGSLAQLFGRRALGTTPHQLQDRLYGVRIDSRQLVEDYFSRLLRVQWLADRLLSSSTFNALTAAAPGM